MPARGKTASLWQWLLNFGRRNRLPVSAGNAVRPLVSGDQILDAVRARIDGAVSTIHFEIYDWGDDDTGRDLLARLVAAQARGVRVLGMVDHLGSWGAVGMLKASGLDLRFYHPVGLRLPWRYWHRRNHRKLLLVDGNHAVLGSANWTDAYNCTLNEACYRDLGLELQGAVVTDLEVDFRKSWIRAKGQPVEVPESTCSEARPAGPDWIPGLSIQVISSLNGGSRALRRHLMLAFRQLRDNALIANAYFIPDPQFLRVLLRTAQRGVNVELLVPGDSDHPFVQAASRATYGRLLRAGVRIRERQERMFHAKTALMDGELVVIGSANLDSRSFRHNLELNLMLRSPKLAEVFRRAVEPDLVASSAWTKASWEALPTWQKGIQRFAYLFWWWL
jgi:cardiolipin synthase